MEATQIEAKKYSYLWKVYDFTKDRTFNQVHEAHPYCSAPVKSMSKQPSDESL